MPAPTPLTACDPPRLDWSRSDAPAAADFDDIYFSVDGGLAETEAVYLSGCGLPERWAGRRNFVIGELGFGSGLNVLAAWRMWEQAKPEGGKLHIVSVEKFPFSASQLARALSAWPELKNYSERLISRWPGPVKGFHLLQLSKDVTLTLIHDDVEPALAGLCAKVDAWFLDGFSPAKNPAMWAPAVMAQISRLSAPGARVGTFTVAGAVRSGLKDAGFSVEKKPGFGRKRQRLEAIFPGIHEACPADISPIILGAGIAGASLARSFMRRGIMPIVIDPKDGTAASSNAAAIVKPRLDLQDRPESRFFLSSYLFALQAYQDDGDILTEGVFHAAKSPEELSRFEKLAAFRALPAHHMDLGVGPYDLKGLNFPFGLTIDPVNTCERFLDGAEHVVGIGHSAEKRGECLIVRGPDGGPLAEGTHIFTAIGAGIREFKTAADLKLRYSRGQISIALTEAIQTMTYGGYAIPLGAHTLLGATHARLREGNPYLATLEDDEENLEKFRAVTGQPAELVKGGARASVRVTQASTLPLVQSSQIMTVITGLGSRGFVFAPLLAETIVADLMGEPHYDLGKIKGP